MLGSLLSATLQWQQGERESLSRQWKYFTKLQLFVVLMGSFALVAKLHPVISKVVTSCVHFLRIPETILLNLIILLLYAYFSSNAHHFGHL